MANDGVVLRISEQGQKHDRLLSLLVDYEILRDAEGRMHVTVPLVLADALVRLFDDVEVVASTALRTSCLNCWEMPSEAGYHDYKSLGVSLDILGETYTGAVFKTSIGRSTEGRALWTIQIPPKSGVVKKRLLLVGCHHAAEWISVEIPLLIAQSILNGTHGVAQAIMDDVEVWVVPMLNPDGHTFSVDYSREWRKSRSTARDGDNVATFGVDLNRNYSVAFGLGLASTSTISNMYCGPAAFSELETSSLRDLCRAYPFDGILSFHAYGREILFPWAHRDPASSGAEIERLKLVAEAMADSIAKSGGSYVAKQAFHHYNDRIGGDFCDWAFRTFGSLALTVEIGPSDEGMRLPSSLIASTYAEFRSGFSAFVESL